MLNNISLEDRKCAECGGELGVTYQKLRGFYSEGGEIAEDYNLELMGPPEFVIHCMNDTEHNWEGHPNLSKKEEEELSNWKQRIIDKIVENHFQD
jgi:hypothetical protein